VAPAPTPAAAQPAPATGTTAPVVRATMPGRRRFYFLAGGAFLKPLSSSRPLQLVDVHGAASLAVQDGPIAGSGASVDSKALVAGVLGYVLPWWQRRLSAELVLGLPFTVHFRATGTLANESLAPMALGIATGVGPLGPDLGEAKATPIVVTATYRPIVHPVLEPYVGAGPSVLLTSNAKVTNPTLNEVNHPDMSIRPAPGLVLQSGLDVHLWDRFYARLDVKFIAFMVAHAEVRHINVRTPDLPLFDSVEVGTAKMDVTVNPLIVQACVGGDFDLW
jgi:outer membrane protein W